MLYFFKSYSKLKRYLKKIDIKDLWGQTVYYEKFVSLYVMLGFNKSIDKIKFYTKKNKNITIKKLNFYHEIELMWPF